MPLALQIGYGVFRNENRHEGQEGESKIEWVIATSNSHKFTCLYQNVPPSNHAIIYREPFPSSIWLVAHSEHTCRFLCNEISVWGIEQHTSSISFVETAEMLHFMFSKKLQPPGFRTGNAISPITWARAIRPMSDRNEDKAPYVKKWCNVWV